MEQTRFGQKTSNSQPFAGGLASFLEETGIAMIDTEDGDLGKAAVDPAAAEAATLRGHSRVCYLPWKVLFNNVTGSSAWKIVGHPPHAHYHN